MKTFEELGVCEEICRAIEELGFEHPMPVQEAVIPLLAPRKAVITDETPAEDDMVATPAQPEAKDIIALAQTGTGKTAAFGLPLLQMINPKNRDTQAVVLSPTRELCLQIADDLRDFSKYIKGINIVAVDRKSVV